MSDYNAFLKSKYDYGANSGFEPLWMPDFLFDFQESLVDWATRKGRAAIFADCGMGKTPMQLVWAQNVIQHTNKPVLVLTPLAVSYQTLREAKKFDIDARLWQFGTNPTTIQVMNYERLHYIDDPSQYGGIVCDESSILKNFDGKRKGQITEFMRQVKYRSLWTATAAPNDWPELGTSSEALGYLGYMDMLSRYFTNKQRSAALGRGRFQQDKWRLKGHAGKQFWPWVASWARAARKPSDLGFGDDDFILPPIEERHTMVKARSAPSGMLFDIGAISFHEEREVIKRTIPERCEMAAEKVAQNGDISMVWCHRNSEGKLLKKLIPNSVEICGSDSEEKRMEAVKWFCDGTDQRRVLISKPKIFGLGMNFQHCAHFTYFPTHSYEMKYQAERRIWRYGQQRKVVGDYIYTFGNERMMENLDRKTKAADEMFTELVYYMNDAINVEKNTYTPREMEVPQWMQ